jgi:prepilin-type N-terminal cleavage/methylation domain-containing protein
VRQHHRLPPGFSTSPDERRMQERQHESQDSVAMALQAQVTSESGDEGLPSDQRCGGKCAGARLGHGWNIGGGGPKLNAGSATLGGNCVCRFVDIVIISPITNRVPPNDPFFRSLAEARLLLAFPTMTEAPRGFTLIELAIVLVVIGLLLGGILKGQELIESARARNLISQTGQHQGGLFHLSGQVPRLAGRLSWRLGARQSVRHRKRLGRRQFRRRGA